MDAKDKAVQLVDKFYSQLSYGILSGKDEPKDERRSFLAKKCAIIAVDEILQELCQANETSKYNNLPYWQSVKSEIEKL